MHCELSSYFEVSQGTVENSLCKGVLRRDNLREGRSFERMCSCEARNRKFEPIVLFGIVWQVTKDQIYKNTLRFLCEQP